jgi:hypothetical protein
MLIYMYTSACMNIDRSNGYDCLYICIHLTHFSCIYSYHHVGDVIGTELNEKHGQSMKNIAVRHIPFLTSKLWTEILQTNL